MTDSKRNRTRAALLDSAAAIIAERGINALSAKEVTTRAGLANGTFYNYFGDRDDVVGQVALRAAVQLGQHLNEVFGATVDARLRVTGATVQALATAAEDPLLGRIMIESIQQLPEMRDEVLLFLKQDLMLGIEQGHFVVADLDLLLDQCAALIMLGIRRQVREGPDPVVVRHTCESLLRIAGMTASNATRIVSQVMAAAD